MSPISGESRTETRLEVHRREFTRAGRVGRMMHVDELTRSEIELVNAEFLSRCHGNAEDRNQIYAAYIETLSGWGIICPHPQQHRLYDGFHKTDIPYRFEESRWYACQLCGVLVINR